MRPDFKDSCYPTKNLLDSSPIRSKKIERINLSPTIDLLIEVLLDNNTEKLALTLYKRKMAIDEEFLYMIANSSTIAKYKAEIKGLADIIDKRMDNPPTNIVLITLFHNQIILNSYIPLK